MLTVKSISQCYYSAHFGWAGKLFFTNITNEQNINFYDNKYINLKRVNIQRKVIISLTTIPSRINNLKPTLISLLDQTRKLEGTSLSRTISQIFSDTFHPFWHTTWHEEQSSQTL